jgi:hypothetical protein
MTTLLRRSMLAALATVVSGAGLVAVAAPAAAHPVESGTVTFSGDPGDYITGGGSYKYNTADGDALNVTASSNNSTVAINISGATGDWWTLEFDAPGAQPLTAGTTYSATRYPFNGAGAGFNLSGEGAAATSSPRSSPSTRSRSRTAATSRRSTPPSSSTARAANRRPAVRSASTTRPRPPRWRSPRRCRTRARSARSAAGPASTAR